MRARKLLVLLGLVALGPFGAACALTQGAGDTADTADAGGHATGDGGHARVKKPDCASCHMSEFLGVRHPPHKGAKPTSCEVCHTQISWHPAVLDHPWPLTGKHEKTDCLKCHTGDPPKTKGTSKKCYACHAAEYDKPPFADHNLLQKTCEDCHTTTDWKNLVPHPIWPPDDTPKEVDAGAHDAGHDAGAKAKPTPTPTPRPKPTPEPTPNPTPRPTPTPTTPTPPPDVTSGGSRHVRGH
jgi:Cytochrome c7 and related cytochrome c